MTTPQNNQLKDYISGLVESIASELNVKEVRLVKDTDTLATCYFDTWHNKTIKMDNPECFSLVFIGDILKDMDVVREYVNKGLKLRQDAGIKVRQPLQSFTINI